VTEVWDAIATAENYAEMELSTTEKFVILVQDYLLSSRTLVELIAPLPDAETVLSIPVKNVMKDP
jgi:hypothetical protein